MKPSIAQKIAKNSLYGRLNGLPKARAIAIRETSDGWVVTFQLGLFVSNDVSEWLEENVHEDNYNMLYDLVAFANADDAMLCYMRFT